MAAARRGRRAYIRKKGRQRQRWPRKVQTTRRKLHYRQRRKARPQRSIRFARTRYQGRRNTTTRHFDRRLRNSVHSSRKTRYPARSYSRKVYRRKPRKVGRPRKEKRCCGVCPHYLSATLKKAARKKQANSTSASVPKKGRRKTRNNEDEVFYSMANTSTLEGTPEEKQSKKHSVHFANTANARTKEAESHAQEELSADSQPSQQPVAPKKRSRHSAAPVHKSR